MRRSSFEDVPVTYGSVGGTQAPDLLLYPPKGYRAIERTARLGSGDERFELAVASLLAWGVQRGAGMRVTEVTEGTGEHYRGVLYSDDGTPLKVADPTAREAVFSADGTPNVTNGATAVLRVRFGLIWLKAPVRVVYLIDTPDRVGFAYGTLAGHPESGEESFVVERREDGSVWFVVRAFSRPARWYSRLGAPFARIVQNRSTARYMRSLLPGRGPA